MKKDVKYAIARASVSHYGHLDVYAYEVLTEGTLKITCQTGGNSNGESYAWTYGVSNDYAVMTLGLLKQGVSLMRKVSRGMDTYRKQDELEGRARDSLTYAEYVLRVLHCAGVKTLYVNENLDGDCWNYKELPCFHVVRDFDDAKECLAKLERKTINASGTTW